MDHAAARRQLNAAQARYDAMEPDAGGPECPECDCEMHQHRGEWVCPDERACEGCGERKHGVVDFDHASLCEECAAEDAECAAERDAEAMDGDHETALASVYGGES